MDPVTRNAINQATTLPAGNVEVQLLDHNGTSGEESVLPLGSAGEFVAVGNDGTATMYYAGQYYATGRATAGNVTAVVRYTLAYQ
ncbi:type 1 fimbria pilin [Paraburkholderia sp. 32]